MWSGGLPRCINNINPLVYIVYMLGWCWQPNIYNMPFLYWYISCELRDYGTIKTFGQFNANTALHYLWDISPPLIHCVSSCNLKHTTTFFFLVRPLHFKPGMVSYCWPSKDQFFIMVDLWYYNQSGVTELLIMRHPHYGRMCFKSVKTHGALHY